VPDQVALLAAAAVRVAAISCSDRLTMIMAELRQQAETKNPSIEQAAEIAEVLADLPSEPQALEAILGILRAR